MPDNASAPQGTAVATRDNSPVGQFQRELVSRADNIRMALPAHISEEKFQRTVLTSVAQNMDLLNADRPSLILACYKAAQDALLPDGREAAFVTFNTKKKVDGQWKWVKLVQYMPMVYGLRKKILQSAEVVSLEVNVVYKAEVEKGTFLYEVGLEPPLRHRPSLDLVEAETTDDQIVAAYSIATMKDGTKSYEIMRRFEIDKVRQVSQTGAVGKTDKDGKKIDPKGPWVDWFPEMAKKTVMRRHAKTLPMSGDVLIDIEGRELERGVSTALALGSAEPDEPVMITDESDTINSETGEIISTNAEPPEPVLHDEDPDPDPDPEPKPKAARGKAKADPAKAQEEPPAQEDELGVTKHPAEAKAEQLLADMARVENIIDLDKLYGKAEADIAAMPDDVRGVVDAAYTRHTKRLSPAKAEAAEAGAK